MKIFKTYTLNWQQIGIFKLAMIAIGMIAGAYFADFVKEYLLIFVVIAVFSSIYVIYVSLKQSSTK